MMGCCCEHCNHDDHSDDDHDKRDIAIGFAIFIVGILLEHVVRCDEPVVLAFFLIGYLFMGYEVIINAAKNALKGRFVEDFLMTIATIGAFIVGAYSEAMGVMLFYRIGEVIEEYADERSRKAISHLMDIRPDHAVLITEDGIRKTVDPSMVPIGSEIFIAPGERVPLDGEIVNGLSSMDTKALTGESLPSDVGVGDTVLSGMINTFGTLIVKTSKDFDNSTANRMIELIEEAESKKARTEKFISRFAKYYTPPVILLALLTFLIPVMTGGDFDEWLYKAIIILVVSCPCALVISVPLSLYCGIGRASLDGLLIKGGNYVEMLAKIDTVVFDKTGTLTAGSLRVSSVNPVSMTEDELLRLAATAEHSSNHPIALTLRSAVPDLKVPANTITEETAGYGITATIDGKNVCVGNSRMMDSMNIGWKKADGHGTAVYISVDKEYAGNIVLSDIVKDDSKKTILDLKKLGVKKTVMLTGDTEEIGQAVGNDLGIDKIYAGLLPADKVKKLEELIDEPDRNGSVAYVGDGINDAPVLARADVGIAMGGIGTDAAIESADVVIMTDEISKVPQAILISKNTMSTAKQNIIFAIGVKFAILILVFLDMATMWYGVFADVGVTAIVVINSLRAGKIANKKTCEETGCSCCPHEN